MPLQLQLQLQLPPQQLLQLQYNCNCNYSCNYNFSYTTTTFQLQLQLHYTTATITTTLHYNHSYRYNYDYSCNYNYNSYLLQLLQLLQLRQLQLQLHFNYTTTTATTTTTTGTRTTTVQLQQHQPHYNYNYCTTPHYIQELWVRWPLQPLQPLQKTQLQPPFGPTTHLSYSVLSLKLPPPPCAALLVCNKLMTQDEVTICRSVRKMLVCWAFSLLGGSRMTTPKVHKMSRLNNHVGPCRTISDHGSKTCPNCVVVCSSSDHVGSLYTMGTWRSWNWFVSVWAIAAMEICSFRGQELYWSHCSFCLLYPLVVLCVEAQQSQDDELLVDEPFCVTEGSTRWCLHNLTHIILQG